MKKINIFPQISLLERYLISQLITPLLFSIVIVTVVAESIGISFEQFRFLIEKRLSFDVLIYLHILKLPEFIIYSLPLAILMATIFTYQKLSENGSYGKNLKFDKISLYLPNISSQFKADREKLDHREMSLYQAYQQLSILETAGDRQNFLKLQVHIQKRFTSAISSTVFALLGSAIGINTKTRVRYNSFALTLGIILIYNMFQLITDILVVSENISLVWVWLPNIVGTGIAGNLLNKKNSLLI